jgi:hypothetical protein
MPCIICYYDRSRTDKLGFISSRVANDVFCFDLIYCLEQLGNVDGHELEPPASILTKLNGNMTSHNIHIQT